MAADGGYDRDVVHRMNERYIAWEALKKMCTEQSRTVDKCEKVTNVYEGVIVPTALYGAETLCMISGYGVV